MRRQKIHRQETKPWPQAKANIRGVGAKIVASEEPLTTPSQIARICAAMDKQSASQTFEKQQVLKEGDYVLPKLPPKGMRFQNPTARRRR